MITEQNLCRNVVNWRIGRIKRVFKWAVAEELVPPSVFHGLQALAGLRYGRTEARETEPIKPVDDQYVDAVLPFVTPHVAAMIQVQRLTGMRPSDVCKMRPSDIDRSADVWVFEPYEHKNRWRGHRRLIPIGPKAQAILRPFLDRDPEAFLFSPKESEAWRLETGRPTSNTNARPRFIRASCGPERHGSRPANDASLNDRSTTGTTRPPIAGPSTTDFPKQKRLTSQSPIGIRINCAILEAQKFAAIMALRRLKSCWGMLGPM